MRIVGQSLLGFALLTAATSFAHGVQLAPAIGSDPMTSTNFVVASSPSSNPFAGATLLDTATSSVFQVFGTSNITHMSLLKGTASVTTNVYRTTTGTVGFSYTISPQNFKDPLDIADFVDAYVSRFSVPGFGETTVDLSASALPSGNVGNNILGVREATNNDLVKFLFLRATLPIDTTPFLDFQANNPPLTLYVQTNAQAYQPVSATLQMVLLEERSKFSVGGGTFDVPSFSIAQVGDAGVPEPASLGTLAFSVAALAIRRRRQW